MKNDIVLVDFNTTKVLFKLAIGAVAYMMHKNISILQKFSSNVKINWTTVR